MTNNNLKELPPEQIVISLDEYAALLYDSYFLEELRIGGVDNWFGYDNAALNAVRDIDKDSRDYAILVAAGYISEDEDFI